MNIKTKVTLVLSILLLSTSTLLSACGRDRCSTVDWYTDIDCYAERGIRNFLRQIERGNLNDITLRIYTPILAWSPLTLEEFIDMSSTDGIIVVEGIQLEEYIDLLRQLKYVELVPVEEVSTITTWLYYVFEDRHGRRIFDFAAWGENDSVFINGVEFERNDVFLEIIVPFLPWYLR